MSDEEYERSYLLRAEFYPATGRTLEGLHGLMFKKDVELTMPTGLDEYLENVDGLGNPLSQFINDVAWDCIKTGFGGVLVDVPYSAENTSILEAEANGVYPYLNYYNSFKIKNWSYKSVGRNKVLDYVILEEENEVATQDRFTKEIEKQYRVLELDPETGYYKQSLYGEGDRLIFETFPKMFGKPMNFIPFYFVPNTKPYQPMMLNLALVNLAWFRKSADLENGAHWTGVPTPYSIGYEPETIDINVKNEHDEMDIITVPKTPMKLGGTNFLYFPSGTQVVGFLEFTGAGLSQLQNMMSQDEERMATLGARIISQERKGVESAETAKIHRVGENSVLATFANELSHEFSNILRTYLEWATAHEIAQDISVHINTDYDVASMNPQELTALVSLWQSGGISKRILFNNLKEGDIVKGDITFEEMEDAILAEQETASKVGFNSTEEIEDELNNE